MSDTIKWKESVTLSWEYQDREATLDELWENWKDQDTSIVKPLIVLAKEKIAETERLREELLWQTQKGVDPVTGKMWLTQRMEENARLLTEVLELRAECDALKERLAFRGKITKGVFCDGCADWEQMAWEYHINLEKTEKENEVLREMNGSMNETLRKVRKEIEDGYYYNKIEPGYYDSIKKILTE